MIVQNVQLHSYNKNLYTKYPVYNNKINFNGIGPIKVPQNTVSDLFKLDNNNLAITFENSVEAIWRKTQEQLQLFTPEKLEKSITEVKTNNPKNSEEEILTVMQKLTQWANYTCFKPLTEKLNELSYKSTYFISNNKLDDVFKYLLSRKKLCKLNYGNSNYFSFISKNNLAEETSSKNNFDRMIKGYINLEGFDDGINFLTDDNNLASFTSNVLKQTNEIILNKPNTRFNEALDEVLNGSIRAKMNQVGLHLETISLNGEPTRETILKQMSPCMPNSKNTIKSVIETVADFFEPHEKDKNLLLKTRIAQFFEHKIDIYSKQRLINLMNEMNEKIVSFQKEHNLEPQKTYYLIQNHNKSYDIITQMFIKNNNIPYDKVFYNIDDAAKCPMNSTIVILDDLSISGESLNNIKTYTLKDDTQVLFCPLIAHSEAVSSKSFNIENSKRINKENIINIIYKDDNSPLSEKEKIVANYFKKDNYATTILGYNGYETNKKLLGGCTTLPYMAPDNNADLSSFLLYLFLPERSALKSYHMNLDDLTYKLKNIE